MKLTPYERERFKRYLAPLYLSSTPEQDTKKEEPKYPFMKKKWWALLNSNFSLWILSVGIVASASYCVSSYRQCTVQAKETLEDFGSLLTEIHVRRDQLAEIAQRAKSKDEFNELAATFKPRHTKYKDFQLHELLSAFRRTTIHIDLGGLFDPSDPSPMYRPIIIGTQWQGLWAVYSGTFFNKYMSITLEDFRDFASAMSSAANLSYPTYRTRTLCGSPSGILSYMFLGSDEVVQFTPYVPPSPTPPRPSVSGSPAAAAAAKTFAASAP